jgi:hypothetical protein
MRWKLPGNRALLQALIILLVLLIAATAVRNLVWPQPAEVIYIGR